MKIEKSKNRIDLFTHLLKKSGLSKFYEANDLVIQKLAISIDYICFLQGVDENEKFESKMHFKRFIFIKSVFKYILLPIWTFTKLRDTQIKGSVYKYVVIRSTHRIDLLNGISKYLEEDETLNLFLINSQLKEFLRIHNNTRVHKNRFIPRPILSLEVIYNQFLIRKKVENFLQDLYSQDTKYYNIRTSVMELLSSFVYHRVNAERIYRRMKRNINSRTLFFFENDMSGSHLALANLLNKFGHKTIHVQHGFLENPYYYRPITRYMFYSAKKDEVLLQSIGVNDIKLLQFGLPFQARLNDVVINTEFENDFLVLAGKSSILTQRQYLSVLSILETSIPKKNIMLRLHPHFSDYEKKYWKDKSSNWRSSVAQESLLKSIEGSQVVITFSYDAAIFALQLGKQIILFIDSSSILFRYKQKLTTAGIYVFWDKETLKQCVNSDLNQNIIMEDLCHFFGEFDVDVQAQLFQHNLQEINKAYS